MANLQTWKTAVDQRDQVIKQANEQIEKLEAADRDDRQKYNDMVGKYNAVVKELNAANAKPH